MSQRKWPMYVAVAALSFSLLGGTVAWAADGQAGQQVEVKVKINGANASVNGQEVAIEKPYVSQGTTMIPLGLLTSSFGATLQYDSQTQMVELSYNGNVIKLKTGSKQVWINGKAVILSAAPEIRNGKTMVPLPLLTQGMGLQVSVGATTNELRITGPKQGDSPKAEGSLDSDSGKTMIGDSYYGWKMKYPTGLIKNYQSFQGNVISFSDAKETYWLYIYVEEDQPENLSGNGLLTRLADSTEHAVLSKEFVNNPTQPYARLISKDEDGNINEERAYQSGSRIYYVTLTLENEADFRNPAKYNSYKDLLDSFSTTFPKGDNTVKDLSTVDGDYRWFTDDDFGLKVKVPAEWGRNYNQDFTFFTNKTGNQWIKIKVTSKEDGLTLDDWVKRHEQKYREEVNENYLKVDPEVTRSTIAGVPAKERKLSSSDGAAWYPEHDIFFFKGNYKFYVEIVYDPEQKPEAAAEMVRTIKQSISVDLGKMNPSLGVIADDEGIDKNKTVTIKDKDYKYSISIPEYWRDTSSQWGARNYEFPGGNFNLIAGPGQLSNVKRTMEKGIEEGTKQFGFTFKENKAVTIAGAQGYKFVIQGNDSGIRFERTLYLIQKGKNTYLIFWTINDAFKTKSLEQRMQNVIDSLQFTD